MIYSRRVSLPPRPVEKENNTQVNRQLSKKSLHNHSTQKSSKNLKIVQVENFVDESLLTHLPIPKECFQIPILEQMPSIELQTVPGWILTPRDFEEFRREVRLYEDKLNRYHEMQKYIRIQHNPPCPLPIINWGEHKTHYRSQVIRQNCSNIDYEKFLLSCRKKMNSYVDDVFLPNEMAFRCKQQAKCLQPHSWKRLWYKKADGLTYQKLQQGIFRTQNLLSCYLALPILCQLNLFEGQNFDGKSAFFVKLNKQGTWRYIMIDNFIPYAKDEISFLSGGFPLTLLEKAWAKYLDSYSRLDSIQDQSIAEIITDLTGAPSQQIKCSDRRFLLTIKLMLSKKYVLIATNQGNITKKMKVEYKFGIPADYSYPVTEIEGQYVLLRNVWGCEASSPFVGTEEIRVHINQFEEYFDKVVINKIIPDWYYNNISVRQRKGYYSLIQLSVTEDTKTFITLSQIDKLNNLEEYSHCKLILFQSCHDSVVYLQQAISNQKKTTLEADLLKGEYLILVEMTWINKEYETTLSVYSSLPVELIKLKYSQENNYLLTLKKHKTQSQKIVRSATSIGKSSRSERFKPYK